MPPVTRKTVSATAALLAVAVIAGCGGSEDGTGSGSKPAPAAADFPSAKGKTLRQVLESSGGQSSDVVSPAAANFYVGTNRYPFGVFTAGQEQITDAQVAIYAAPGRGVDGPAIGPFPARIEDLSTRAAFRAKTTSDDPDSAQVAYIADIPLDKPGPWAFAALIRTDGGLEYSLLPSPNPVGDYPMPRVGANAPAVHTLTADEVADISEIDTRVPPDDMHSDDLADVLGRKPAVLLLATPALCQSRVCGPVTDIAQQVKQEYGDRVAFIHQEVYRDNDITKGPRPQMQAYNLTTEPWCFVMDRGGKVSAVLQGPFSVQELEAAVQKVAS
jgi:hypothetical protein